MACRQGAMCRRAPLPQAAQEHRQAGTSWRQQGKAGAAGRAHLASLRGVHHHSGHLNTVTGVQTKGARLTQQSYEQRHCRTSLQKQGNEQRGGRC